MNGESVRQSGDVGGGGDAVFPPAAGAADAEVSVAVNTWVEQVGQFLAVLQKALEETRLNDDASAEVRAFVAQLPAIIRECRAQVPTPEMIRTWVRSVAHAGQNPMTLVAGDAPRLLHSGAA